jgi:hypothetical protein
MEQNSLEQSFRNTQWIEGLALEELKMEDSGIVSLDQHLSPIYHLEESSIQIMNRLKDRFEFYIQRFNEYRGKVGSSSQIRIFKISNTVNDFMLFRNSLKLVLARKSCDVISVGFLSNAGGLFSARLSPEIPATNTAHEIKAHVGPFNKVTWRFMGEVVDEDALVRHYITEFIKHSAR